MRSIKGKRQIRKGMYRAEFIRFDNVIPGRILAIIAHIGRMWCNV